MMTEREFLAELERLIALHPEYALERLVRDGDILLRRRRDRANARAQNMAAAFQSIMRADGSKKRGGGWV